MFNIFFIKSYRLLDNMEIQCRAGQATDDNTIWRICIACWITNATETPSEYVILIALPLRQCLHERATMLRHSCLACLCLCLLYRNKVSVNVSHKACRLRHKNGLMIFKDVIAAYFDTDTKSVNTNGNILGCLML